ncbi:DUF922 domain-containing protein [Winogradskyella litoriviva]|uniref:DUF922 domain-containing protein n=1 Tax=Winogradskyella litoriviva TaxID=1220182 RepID=A0ABX2E9A5_9FLAO|nr:DUF922 domain-containing protein [Winogradskyella litoriviva]NRD24666.1 DUF922 domain-containing protein [Winogradskyella litoriviva]
MDKIKILSLLILFLMFSSTIKSQSIIKWSKDKKLTWSDFKGPPNLDVIAYAQTAYKIEILPSNVQVDDENNIQNYTAMTAEAVFYTQESWVYEKSDYLLKHEQLHFDIAALFANKIKIAFNTLIKAKNANFDSYLEVYQKLWAKCLETQKKYDTETQHGQLVKENDEWIERINNEINSIE